MTHSRIVSPTRRGDFDFTVRLADETWEGFRIGDIAQGKVSTDDLMCFCIYGQMQFSPDPPFFLTMFFYLPLPFTKDVEPGRVDNEVCNFTPRWDFKRDVINTVVIAISE